jgi:Fungal specific transcription factor domain
MCEQTRCDPALPRCSPCERSNAHCEYFDSTKNRTISRTYITSLQENVRRLQAELAAAEKTEPEVMRPEIMARGAGLIKFSENDESRFLGPSSGIAITRFVMELAKQYTKNKSIKDIVPTHTAQEIKEKFDVESAKPTSKVYPLISSVAAPSLPSHDLMERLIDLYMAKAQYMLPLLHEPTFRQEIKAVYSGSTDPKLNFQLRLVIAISMQRLDRQYAGLADSYYLAALQFLDAAVRRMDLSSLQCFALIAQYSLLTPTRTASYWVVGIAARLCQELGLCEEKTISQSPEGVRYNTLELDMRRRLFWIILSMEYGLAHSLGRPSCFGVSVDHINVEFFALCDDQYITTGGLLPGHHPIMKKCISIHFLRMRLLQAEIRRTLYLKKRDTPISEEDPWFEYMLKKIDAWMAESPKNDEGSGLSEKWFIGRRNTMIVFMYRPSPQIPQPSTDAAERCYEASIFNIALQKAQVEGNLIDITWIFTQAIFMALNTVLWSLSYQAIREAHPKEEVMRHVQDALAAIDLCADRWPGVQSARQLYEHLILGCIRAYDFEGPISEKLSPSSTQDAASPLSQIFSYSPASSAQTSLAGPQSPPPFNHSYAAYKPPTSQAQQVPPNSQYNYGSEASFHSVSRGNSMEPSQPSGFTQPNGSFSQPSHIHGLPALSRSPEHNKQNITNPFAENFTQVIGQALPAWSMDATTAAYTNGFPAFAAMDLDQQPWLGSFGDAYSQYMQQTFFPTAHQARSLSEAQQIELMAALERSQLPDVPTTLISNANTFYTPNFG